MCKTQESAYMLKVKLREMTDEDLMRTLSIDLGQIHAGMISLVNAMNTRVDSGLVIDQHLVKLALVGVIEMLPRIQSTNTSVIDELLGRKDETIKELVDGRLEHANAAEEADKEKLEMRERLLRVIQERNDYFRALRKLFDMRSTHDATQRAIQECAYPEDVLLKLEESSDD